MATKPTDGQVAFAKQLGIDFDDTVTRSGLSALITDAHTRKRVEESGRHEMPNHIATAVRHDLVTTDYRRSFLEAVRLSGLKLGSIVRFRSPRWMIVKKKRH